MPLIELRSLEFSYPDSTRVLDIDSFTVERGEFLVLCGRSGCGKSTLLRLLKPSLAPHGLLTGELLFDGKPLFELDRASECARIGFLLQSPDAQSVTDKVWHELAFGLESLGLENSEIRRRVNECTEFFGLGELFYKNIAELSGGQKQRVNLAAIMSMRPELIILDEPTSQLDPGAASSLLAELKRVNVELGTTVILAEHRLEQALTLADRVVVMEDGRIIVDCKPREAASRLCALDGDCTGLSSSTEANERSFHPMLAAMPTAARVFAICASQLVKPSESPLTIDEGRALLSKFPIKSDRIPHETPGTSVDTILALDSVSYIYESSEVDAVHSTSLTLHRGEITAIIGANGSGKSTLLKLAAGIYEPHSGSVTRSARLVYLPQNPQTLFVKSTVGAELRAVAKQSSSLARLDKIVESCKLSHLMERHPYDLSGGEIQRAALAKLLLFEPELILMDEPTKGLDALTRRDFADIMSALRADGRTVLLVTHDMELCASVADRCVLMREGRAVADESPLKLFETDDTYTTAASLMARGIIPGAIKSEEILSALGCAEVYREVESKVVDSTLKAAEPLAQVLPKPKLSSKALLGVLILLLAIPLTLLWGIFFLDTSQYYVTALLVLFECMIPFFLVFESRRPKARELVLLASLCAIGVAGRAALFMLPQLKPVAALAIITGAALGGQAGFLVGAVTMLASNMMFSQGPWTPWQMFAMGLIGFFAGILFGRGGRAKKLPLAIYGFVSSVVIWGGIMNPASALMWVKSPSVGVILAYMATGLPLDLIQGTATAIFLLLSADPMLEKLERIRIKYGMLE